jgi:glycosyltransferase involved in cell wall biosynthesis
MLDATTSVIIPWCNRPELRLTLASNTRWLKAIEADVIVVNCGGDPDALDDMLTAAAGVCPRQIDVPAERFNKSLALNLGVHFADGSVIATLDADILLAEGAYDDRTRCLRERCFLTFRRVIDSGQLDTPPPPPPEGYLQGIITESISEFVWGDSTRTRVQRMYIDGRNGTRAGPGLIVARKEDLIAIGGYRSDLQGWGWEDLDVHLRLSRVGLERVWIDTRVVHVTHQDDARDVPHGNTTADAARRNLRRACALYSKGDFSGTYGRDVAAWQARCRVRVVGGTDVAVEASCIHAAAQRTAGR